ncbi:NUDIX domain-containing protein [Pedobacter sp. SD-b]|uniref:NUDIX domain-containing protein n=1 Tax=Pedobacter segetis TaxID=2793069 RepID=A0ABS1BI26_9SPHI|nr:NUDIX domain-containing protein [Pedobacter segetis]MBK0382487.1 NUDIX domain-containing protein [Pedobacter segetis]
MAQKYNIYINQKCLIITSNKPNGAFGHQLIDDQHFDFLTFYKALGNNPNAKYYLICEDAKNTFKTLKSKLRVIEAAGGLVHSDEDKYLFIKRNGRWDLPKGKLEPNEKKKDAAVREVEEECGLKIRKLGDKLLKTYHVYEIKGKPVLKVSHWYAMEAKSKQKLVPQLEEGITEVKWFKKEDWGIIRANTYANIMDVIDED